MNKKPIKKSKKKASETARLKKQLAKAKKEAIKYKKAAALLKKQRAIKEKRFAAQGKALAEKGKAERAAKQKASGRKPRPPRKRPNKPHKVETVKYKPGESPRKFFARAKRKLEPINENKQFLAYSVYNSNVAVGFETISGLEQHFEDQYELDLNDTDLGGIEVAEISLYEYK